jgi:hypothetical protein
MTVHLDAAKPPSCHGVTDHIEDVPGVPGWMDEGEANEPVRVLRDDAGDLRVRMHLIAMK